MSNDQPTSSVASPLQQRPSKVHRRSTSKYVDNENDITINFVEFYCGVGGWSMALLQALNRVADSGGDDDSSLPNKSIEGKSLRCVAALDHSDICTKVYKHNNETLGDGKDADPTTTSIERLTMKTVKKWNAAIWAMSPPCQPHTRQHDNQKEDLQDPRSKSFLHLCTLIETMEEEILPQLILVENVVGFETSQSCVRMRQVFAKRNYSVGHFHLTPTQVGIPNDRPRYYCVSVRLDESVNNVEEAQQKTALLKKYVSLEKVQEGIDVPDCTIYSSLEELGVNKNYPTTTSSQPKEDSRLSAIQDFLDKDGNDNLLLRIPDKTLSSNAAWCFDIVTAKSQRSSCFTHAYGKFVRGTGSAYYFGAIEGDTSDGPPFKLVSPEERRFEEDWSKGLDLKNGMRYFSGNEISRLMDYTEGFTFPADVTMKQQWKLLGNSLNVRVAGRMCELGLRLILLKKAGGGGPKP